MEDPQNITAHPHSCLKCLVECDIYKGESITSSFIFPMYDFQKISLTHHNKSDIEK